ncbi:hypothetical protein DFH07DRAFT_780053 [Mycena maculata]|uniref:Uncharacterized protein n=1 Tax=Mycena maculata TaxID=230809 RepID=A0AAD7I6M8_9AGAR|nr:hypothetical protein DFH07DRAFT_780053 [Mycena maculata]
MPSGPIPHDVEGFSAVTPPSRPVTPYEDIQFLLANNSTFHRPLQSRPTRTGRSRPSTTLFIGNGLTPQTEYYGYEVLPDGQLLHQSASLNVFRVHENPETGEPFTINSHEFTLTLQAPTDNRVWPREVIYPSTERLKDKMAQLAPTLEPAFPVHAVPVRSPEDMEAPLGSPTMTDSAATIDPQETLKKVVAAGGEDDNVGTDKRTLPPIRIVTDLSSLVNFDYAPRHYNSTHPHEQDSSSDSSLGSPPPLIPESPLFTPIPFTEDLPEFSTNISGGNGRETHDGVGICGHCFGLQHDLSACPMWGDDAPTSAAAAASAKAVEITRRDMEMKLRREELQKIIQEALEPGLVEVVGTTAGARQLLDRLKMTVHQARELAAALTDDLGPLREKMEKETMEMFVKELEYVVTVEVGRLLTHQLLDREAMSGESADDYIRPNSPDHANDDADMSSEEAAAVLVAMSQATRVVFVPSSEARSGATGTYSSRIPARSDEVSTPVFPSRGRPITRENRSSSPAPSSISSSSYEEISPYTTTAVLATPASILANELGTMDPDSFPSPTSEWSVSSVDFSVNPQHVIDVAVARVIADAPAREGSPSHETAPNTNNTSNSEATSSDSGSTTTADFLTAIEHVTGQTRTYIPQDDEAFTQHDVLMAWADDGLRDQLALHRHEEEMAGNPFREALRIFHGPLVAFMDTVTMRAESVARVMFNSSVFLALRPRYSPPSTPPSSGQTSTSLDFSLPDQEQPSTPPSANKGNGKRSAEEEGGRARKCFRKFAGDSLRRKTIKQAVRKAKTIRHFAATRHAALEGIRWIEGILWMRYGVNEVITSTTAPPGTSAEQPLLGNLQNFFPVNGRARHPILTDNEAARTHTLWSILAFQQCHDLADILSDFLIVRLKDEYAVSRLLDAGFLESIYPTGTPHTRWWELLAGPEACSHSDMSDSHSSSDISDSSSDMDGVLAYPTASELEAAAANHTTSSTGPFSNAPEESFAVPLRPRRYLHGLADLLTNDAAPRESTLFAQF